MFTSQMSKLVRQLKIPTNRTTQIIAGRRNVATDTALRENGTQERGKTALKAAGKRYSTQR